MTVATATSQRGLNYCAHLGKIFVGDCDDPKEDVSSCCSSSEGSGVCEQSDFEEEHNSECLPQRCLFALFFEMGDFVNSVQEIRDLSRGADDSSLDSSCFSELNFLFQAHFLSIDNGKRGPPSSAALSEPVPLFIRHSVFLI